MTGYEALDLTELANAPASLLQDPDTLEIGATTRFGLPFRLGTGGDPERVFLAVTPDSSARLGVSASAEWIIFAHALVDTDLFEGRDLGRTAADYEIVYDDGAVVSLPIRERFEIAASPRDRFDRPIPLDWGQSPFLAIPELEHVTPHRTHGRFDHAGGRAKEVLDPSTKLPYTLPYRWYLWPWRNPRPDAAIAGIRFSSLGPTVLVAGVTLGHLDEDPFERTTNRDVLITLPFGATNHDIEKLDVSVDRGTASFPYWVVTDEAALAEAPVTPAWGQSWDSESPRVAHVRLTGTPSATVTVRFDGDLVGAANWGELVEHGAIAGAGAGFRIVNEARTWVRTTVVDADSGEPIPCRVHFRSKDGVSYPPHGHPPHINGELATFAFDLGGDVRLGNKSYAYIDGTCEGWLPVGPVTVELAQGFEYDPRRVDLEIVQGQATLELALQRFSRIRDRGYVSGDTHGHFVSARGAQFEGAGEGLDIVNLQRTQGGELFTVTEEVRTGPLTGSAGSPIVFVGQENRTGMFGHVNLLGVRTPVMPISTGGPDESEIGTGLETTLSRWADETRAQGGITVLAHFPVPNGEAATLIATKRIDAIEMIAYDDYNVREYYRYLNDGYQVPIVGGSDKMTADVPLGIVRTYAGGMPGTEVDYFSWLAAVQRGDTFASSGPLVVLEVEGARPGSVLTGVDLARVNVRVDVSSVFTLDHLEIVGRDGVLASVDLDGRRSAEEEFVLPLPRDTWICARAFASGVTAGRHHDVYTRRVAAHTSPVYVSGGVEYAIRDADTQRYMATLIDGAMDHIRHVARRFWPGHVGHRHGREDHLAYLLEPFEEARDIVRRRLDQWS
ncbi:CehA/McbA family metallohydrolase [Microbacterium sp. ARD31]|uniref:CehA/McbA family metallohydrolase n=1 Tax=Microbacterium sp. ARD31 TaxID=2962576 RepID=UPI0028827DE2|nr:CehA/McbA family metallohydrolase [Microbacterium sp. ARD31]MDT0186050.1 CehA/McbA family metallohydrolase [Microbacterium sp. ARD31]